MLLELLFVLFATVITNGLMLCEAEPVGLTVIKFAFYCRMVWTRVDDKICVSNEEVFLRRKFGEGLFTL